MTENREAITDARLTQIVERHVPRSDTTGAVCHAHGLGYPPPWPCENYLMADELIRGRSKAALLDAALEAVVVAVTLDVAQGIAHAALHREEYHGHETGAAQ